MTRQLASDHVDHTMVEPTPFHQRTAQLNRRGQWTSWSGYSVVPEYTHVDLEYAAVRNRCGVMDVSPIIKYEITGREAQAYLNRLVTRDISKIKTGYAAYVLFCNELGHVLDDGIVFKFSNSQYWLQTQDRHLPWLLDSAIGFAVNIEDKTDQVAGLAIQGPSSTAVLQDLGLIGIESLPLFAWQGYSKVFDGLLVSRTGFTGDLGYELWLEPENAHDLWDALMQAGEPHGINVFGGKALDILRIEAGFALPGVDFMPAQHLLRKNRGRSPLALGLGRLLDFDKGFFNGRQALLEEHENGSDYQLVGLEIDGNKVAADAWIYHRKRRHVGTVTSATWSPTLKSNIALAWLDSSADVNQLWVDVYSQKELKWQKNWAACKVVKRPFYRPKHYQAISSL